MSDDQDHHDTYPGAVRVLIAFVAAALGWVIFVGGACLLFGHHR